MFWIEYLEERGKFHLVSYFVVSYFLNAVRLCFYSHGSGFDLFNPDSIIGFILPWGFVIIFSALALLVQPYVDLFFFSANLYGPETPFAYPLSVGTDLAFACIAACVFQILVILWHVSRCMSYLADDL